ncbi:hypothetical protein DFH09DRAFT_1007487 [Mycena vulgaris]|nr:hypothetical protein DFH09DRAFT_1007487 [Mycena vulgaris]
MQFTLSIAAVLQLVAAAGLVHAAPAAESDYPLVISHIIPVGEYNMTYWIDGPGTVAARSLVPRQCGSNDVTCSGGHSANSGVCQQLLNSLNVGTTIGNSPRSICLGQGSNQCCVAWSGAVGDMTESNLSSPANKIFSTCFSATSGSGLARNVDLNGNCVTECLSNRPTGCS